MYAPLVACLDKQFNVCVHEWYSHSNGCSVGKDEVRVLAETLDDAEDVIPSSAVETTAVIAELINNLHHWLEPLPAFGPSDSPRPSRKRP